MYSISQFVNWTRTFLGIRSLNVSKILKLLNPERNLENFNFEEITKLVNYGLILVRDATGHRHRQKIYKATHITFTKKYLDLKILCREMALYLTFME